MAEAFKYPLVPNTVIPEGARALGATLSPGAKWRRARARRLRNERALLARKMRELNALNADLTYGPSAVGGFVC